MTDNQITPFGQTRSLMSVDPAAVAAGEAVKARIQAGYIMAYQAPRNIDEARVRILKFCESPEFAETVEYSKPIGNTKIKGLSIRFAEVALSTFRNILTEAQLLYEDDNIKRIRISALDLEGNTQFSRDISIKKTVERKSIKGREDDLISQRQNSYNQTVYLVRATEDEVMTKESAYVSKFIRTEGLRLLPADIKNEAIAKSRETLSKRDQADPAAAKKRILDAFSRLNIWPKDLEKYIGHSTDTISPAEIAELRTIYSAIDSGEATWSDYMAKPEFKDTKDQKDPAADGKKESKKTAPPPETVAEVDDKFKTPAEFAKMVKDQTGKEYVFIPAKDGLAHDLLSGYIEFACGNQAEPMTPNAMMIAVSDKGVFPGFWNGFDGGTWKQHFSGKLPETPAAEKMPEKEPAKEKDSGPSAGTGNVHNAFELNWKTNTLKKVGLARFWDTNKKDWELASDAAKIDFREKWIRCFTENGSLIKPFPAEAPTKQKKYEPADPIDKSESFPSGDDNVDGLDTAVKKEEAVKIDYQKKFVDIQLTDPEGLIKACEVFGYGAQIVIPMSENKRKELYETYLEVKKADAIA